MRDSVTRNIDINGHWKEERPENIPITVGGGVSGVKKNLAFSAHARNWLPTDLQLKGHLNVFYSFLT